MLDTLTELLFSADDDTLCDPRVDRNYSNYNSEIELKDKFMPYPLQFFDSFDDARNSTQGSDVDFLAEHEQFLGKSINSCIFDRIDDLRSIDARAGSDVNNSDAHVMLTFNGLVGDVASNFNAAGLLLDERRKALAFKSEEIFNQELQKRNVKKFYERQIITPINDLCMTTFIGLDNRNLLPPFFPIYRMEDSLFGKMLKIYSRSAYQAYLPTALIHKPEEHRENVSKFKIVNEIYPTEIVSELVKNFGCLKINYNSMEGYLVALGGYIKEFIDMPNGEYSRAVLYMYHLSLLNKLEMLEKIRKDSSDLPCYWLEHLKKNISSIKTCLINPVPMAPMALVKAYGLHRAEGAVKAMVGDFADLLIWWPKIVDTAKSLRKKGIRLSREV